MFGLKGWIMYTGVIVLPKIAKLLKESPQLGIFCPFHKFLDGVLIQFRAVVLNIYWLVTICKIFHQI